MRKRLSMLTLAVATVLVFFSVINAANTVDTSLTGAAPAYCTRVAVPAGSGNWVTVNLDPTRKYMIRNYGIDSSGATAANRVKVALGSAAEPDAGAVITFAAETNTEIMKVDDYVYPIRGTTVVSMKAETGTTMVVVRTIEVLSSTER